VAETPTVACLGARFSDTCVVVSRRLELADEATLNEQKTVPVRTEDADADDGMPQIFLNNGDNKDLDSELDAMDPLLEVSHYILDLRGAPFALTQSVCVRDIKRSAHHYPL